MQRRAFLAGLTGLALPGAAMAQGGSDPVLTIDPDRLFAETAFGQRALRSIEERSTVLARENRRIEAELIAEERALTEQRPSLSVEEFRALADAFDEKVQRLREEQDAKTREIQGLREDEQQRFLGEIAPILSNLIVERGASVVVDRRSVFLSAARVDITDDAIRMIDDELGDGTATPQTDD